MSCDHRQALLQCAGPLIQRKVKQLVRRHLVTRQDAADLEQTLLLAVLRRAARFDPGKTSCARFVTLLIRHAVVNVLRRRLAAKRRVRPRSLSRRVKTAEGCCALADLVSAADQPARLGTSPRQDAERLDLAIDVAAVLAKLSPPQQDLARRLKSQTRAEAARALGISSAALNTQVRRLRRVFAHAGLDRYLHDAS
jgi:RNA polymerase sigma factor (sigma-70 family)